MLLLVFGDNGCPAGGVLLPTVTRLLAVGGRAGGLGVSYALSSLMVLVLILIELHPAERIRS